MKKLREFVKTSAVRGACQCGRCIDAPENPEDHQPEGHTADVHFFKVALAPTVTDRDDAAKTLASLLRSKYPQQDRLASGPSYIEMGGALGDQGIALMLIGLGELLGLWQVITPVKMGIPPGAQADALAGGGMVMCSGLKEDVAV